MLTDLNETYTVQIPSDILAPVGNAAQEVKIKPLTLQRFQLIAKAAKDDPALVPVLVIKESVTEPDLTIQNIHSMKVGLVNFLINEIKRLSGIIQ